ncbi:ABC transporter ATP-binding protein [Clostridium gasigenes]|uniref:ATP-binding cassette, subfamily B n=1 Tax=Clostridium gasigenes TaxID=94869 RepID=A0A1H0NVW8_9CLOT|nr:ABC transporter ATP-binding protein [Clostridium gasigenes]MBU3087647.1 ABC transporter ATP-binding protein/permease [Clostridium gasigenes]SDO96666.1 ATP-binding cassette, subfamily B [Clostridium gasigenes]
MNTTINIIKKYYMFFSKYKILFTILIISTILASVTQFMTPLYLGKIIDAIGEKSFLNMKQYIFIVILFFIITMTFSVIETYISSYLQINIQTELEKYLFDKIVNSKIEVLDKLKGPEIINRLEEDTNIISSFYITKLSDYIIEIIKLAISIILIFIISIKLSIIALILVPFNFISTIILSKKLKKIQRLTMTIKDKNRAYIQEIIYGYREVKSLVIENEVSIDFNKNIDMMKNLSLKQTIFTTISNSVSSISSFSINLILVVYSGWLIINGNLTLGEFVAFNSYIAYFLSSIKTMWNIPIDIQLLEISDDRVSEIIEYEIEELKLQADNNDIRGAIRFEDVNFKYNNMNKLAINCLNIEIENNKLTALIGENGAGKTTILNLLTRFYCNYSGSIFIGEKDIKEFNLKDFRKNITYIQQSTFLFNKSIKDNLKLGIDDISNEEIIIACKEVNIHNYIESLPNKYDTIIDNNGKILSGGQKQKLAIVRGLLRKTPIFLFDEINKGLDFESSRKLMSIIKCLSKRNTVVMISHNKNIFDEADTIIYLKDGAIINE